MDQSTQGIVSRVLDFKIDVHEHLPKSKFGARSLRTCAQSIAGSGVWSGGTKPHPASQQTAIPFGVL
jgi:hypothetical protein